MNKTQKIATIICGITILIINFTPVGGYINGWHEKSQGVFHANLMLVEAGSFIYILSNIINKLIYREDAIDIANNTVQSILHEEERLINGFFDLQRSGNEITLAFMFNAPEKQSTDIKKQWLEIPNIPNGKNGIGMWTPDFYTPLTLLSPQGKDKWRKIWDDVPNPICGGVKNIYDKNIADNIMSNPPDIAYLVYDNGKRFKIHGKRVV